MSVSTSHSSLRWVLLVLLAFLVFVLLQRQQLYGATSRASLLFPSTSASGGGVPSITQTLQPRFGFKHSPPPPMGNPPLPLVKHAADLTPPQPPPLKLHGKKARVYFAREAERRRGKPSPPPPSYDTQGLRAVNGERVRAKYVRVPRTVPHELRDMRRKGSPPPTPPSPPPPTPPAPSQPLRPPAYPRAPNAPRWPGEPSPPPPPPPPPLPPSPPPPPPNYPPLPADIFDANATFPPYPPDPPPHPQFPPRPGPKSNKVLRAREGVHPRADLPPPAPPSPPPSLPPLPYSPPPWAPWVPPEFYGDTSETIAAHLNQTSFERASAAVAVRVTGIPPFPPPPSPPPLPRPPTPPPPPKWWPPQPPLHVQRKRREEDLEWHSERGHHPPPPWPPAYRCRGTVEQIAACKYRTTGKYKHDFVDKKYTSEKVVTYAADGDGERMLELDELNSPPPSTPPESPATPPSPRVPPSPPFEPFVDDGAIVPHVAHIPPAPAIAETLEWRVGENATLDDPIAHGTSENWRWNLDAIGT